MSASDGDRDSVTYTLDTRHIPVPFRLESDTGAFYVTDPLDRELTSYYSLVVVATDSGKANKL